MPIPAPQPSPRVTAPLPIIEGALGEFLARAVMPGNLRGAVEYAVLGGGKRLRPLLVWHCCAAAGAADPSVCLPAAVAVELVHAFSLVHDDLPAMDDDDLRRGKPTLHIHAGEAMAILAGDAMTVLAFQALESIRDPATRGAVSSELSAGTLGMIIGQVYDTVGGLATEGSEADRVKAIHSCKTGALIRAACGMGAVLGGALGDAPARIHTYAQSIGLMFQIVDDILDVTQPTEALGKRSNKDAGAGKLTFPAILGLEGARAAVAAEHRRAVWPLSALGAAAQPLVELADFMAIRTT